MIDRKLLFVLPCLCALLAHGSVKELQVKYAKRIEKIRRKVIIKAEKVKLKYVKMIDAEIAKLDAEKDFSKVRNLRMIKRRVRGDIGLKLEPSDPAFDEFKPEIDKVAAYKLRQEHKTSVSYLEQIRKRMGDAKDEERQAWKAEEERVLGLIDELLKGHEKQSAKSKEGTAEQKPDEPKGSAAGKAAKADEPVELPMPGKAYTAVCYIRYAGTWEIFHNGQAIQRQAASDEGVQVEFEMKDGDLLAASFSRPRTLEGNKVKFAINIKDTPFWWHMRDGKSWQFYQHYDSPPRGYEKTDFRTGKRWSTKAAAVNETNEIYVAMQSKLPDGVHMIPERHAFAFRKKLNFLELTRLGKKGDLKTVWSAASALFTAPGADKIYPSMFKPDPTKVLKRLKFMDFRDVSTMETGEDRCSFILSNLNNTPCQALQFQIEWKQLWREKGKYTVRSAVQDFRIIDGLERIPYHVTFAELERGAGKPLNSRFIIHCEGKAVFGSEAKPGVGPKDWWTMVEEPKEEAQQ